jgi:hypothetical protein
MKILVLSLVLLLGFTGWTQEKQEALFQYNISVRSIDTTAKSKQTALMMQNSSMKMYLCGDSLRFEHVMGRLLTRVQILDKSQQNALTLIDGPMGKTATYSMLDDIDYAKVEKDSNSVVVEFDDEKTILGYTCRKIMLRQDGNVSTHWGTTEIHADLLPEGMTNPNIPGFPLESIEVADGLEITRKASNILFEIENKSTLFNMEPPVGYIVK